MPTIANHIDRFQDGHSSSRHERIEIFHGKQEQAPVIDETTLLPSTDGENVSTWLPEDIFDPDTGHPAYSLSDIEPWNSTSRDWYSNNSIHTESAEAVIQRVRQRLRINNPELPIYVPHDFELISEQEHTYADFLEYDKISSVTTNEMAKNYSTDLFKNFELSERTRNIPPNDEQNNAESDSAERCDESFISPRLAVDRTSKEPQRSDELLSSNGDSRSLTPPLISETVDALIGAVVSEWSSQTTPEDTEESAQELLSCDSIAQMLMRRIQLYEQALSIVDNDSEHRKDVR